MNILITGALGFAGCSISNYLIDKKLSVIGIDKILFDNKQLSKLNKKKNFTF